jgi:ATP-binding cassette subfamily B protein
VERVLEVVQLRDEVAGFPEGVRTLVGEKGVTLSGGQRQRLALGRALISRRPFLILDAPFSSVDVSTEQRILEAIRSEYGDITLVMSSQRVASFMKADRIFMVESGAVQASGSHEELLTRSEAYRNLIQEISLGIGRG